MTRTTFLCPQLIFRVKSVKHVPITAISTSTSYIWKLPKHSRYKHVGDERGELRVENFAVVFVKFPLGCGRIRLKVRNLCYRQAFCRLYTAFRAPLLGHSPLLWPTHSPMLSLLYAYVISSLHEEQITDSCARSFSASLWDTGARVGHSCFFLALPQ